LENSFKLESESFIEADIKLSTVIPLIVLIAKENQIIVLLLSKIIFVENMYWTAPGHSGTAGPIHISNFVFDHLMQPIIYIFLGSIQIIENLICLQCKGHTGL
jgi:hypothetical protein